MVFIVGPFLMNLFVQSKWAACLVWTQNGQNIRDLFNSVSQPFFLLIHVIFARFFSGYYKTCGLFFFWFVALVCVLLRLILISSIIFCLFCRPATVRLGCCATTAAATAATAIGVTTRYCVAPGRL